MPEITRQKEAINNSNLNFQRNSKKISSIIFQVVLNKTFQNP